MATAILNRSRLNKTRKTTTTTTRKPTKIIVEIPYGVDDDAATQAPLHAVITQLERYRPTIDQLTYPAHAKAETAAINRDNDLGFRAWGCKIVGLIVEVPTNLARRLANNDGDSFGRRSLDD